MANILNPIIANQPLQATFNKGKEPSFTFDTDGKIKPFNDKGVLLPSKIFDSPSDIVKDFGKDVLSIGKAAKGKANDHELGRINDIAMKAGSAALATYLFVKNPLKLSKSMEFAGLGTFFASMALWPKLAIQAPLKARTGVDIHQKYIDSQGRKKMLYQDPQYVLTDLYSKDDLDNMGKKLKVNENLPDRESFIKQRAQKTALQGNTLWMMTAGAATPVMSALGCNVLEKPISKAIEKSELKSTAKALDTPYISDTVHNLHVKARDKSFDKFLAANADKKMTPEFISELSKKVTGDMGSAEITTAFSRQLSKLQPKASFDAEFVKTALKGKVDGGIIDNVLSGESAQKALKEGRLKNVAELISKSAEKGKPKQQKLAKTLFAMLDGEGKKHAQPTLGEVSSDVRKMFSTMRDFAQDKKVLDKYLDARVGERAGSYLANQWGRFSGKVTDVLAGSSVFAEKDLKSLAAGDYKALNSQLQRLVKSDRYDGVVSDLLSMTTDFESTVGEKFMETVSEKTVGKGGIKGMFHRVSKSLTDDGFVNLANSLYSSNPEAKTVQHVMKNHTASRALGERASFYRMLQTLDLHKKIADGTLKKELQTQLTELGKTADESTIKKLIKSCNKVLLSAQATDWAEKLQTLDLSQDEYKVVVNTLFGDKSQSAIKDSLSKRMDADDAEKLLQGFKKYKAEFMEKVGDRLNGITPELERRSVNGVKFNPNSSEAADLIGRSVQDMLKDSAKQRLNSNKWLKIFGGTMVALTAATIIATTTFGKKDKTEKQAEAETGANG